MMRWMLLLGVATAVPAQAAEKFDLQCEGTEVLELDGPASPFSFSMRVDLENLTYCRDECDTVWSIDEVMPDNIVFIRTVDRSPNFSLTSHQQVSRKTGDYEWEWIQTRPRADYRLVKAVCEPRPFSGFPETKF